MATAITAATVRTRLAGLNWQALRGPRAERGGRFSPASAAATWRRPYKNWRMIKQRSMSRRRSCSVRAQAAFNNDKLLSVYFQITFAYCSLRASIPPDETKRLSIRRARATIAASRQCVADWFAHVFALVPPIWLVASGGSFWLSQMSASDGPGSVHCVLLVSRFM